MKHTILYIQRVQKVFYKKVPHRKLFDVEKGLYGHSVCTYYVCDRKWSNSERDLKKKGRGERKKNSIHLLVLKANKFLWEIIKLKRSIMT